MQVDELRIPSKKIQISSFEDEVAKEFAEGAKSKTDTVAVVRIAGNSYSKEFCREFAQFLSRTQQLQRLDINDIFVGRLKSQIPESIQDIAIGLKGKNLLHLDISNNAVNPFGAKALLNYLEQATSLKTLLIANCGLGIMGVAEIAQGLKGTPNLQVFAIGRNRVENEGAVTLSKVIQHIPNLKALHIYQNSIKKIGLKPLFEEISKHCKDFETFDLCDNFVREEATIELGNLISTCKHIKHLNLSDCLQEGENETIVAALEKLENPQIEKLGYNYNELSNPLALRLLEVLKKCPLKRLEIVGNEFQPNTEKAYNQALAEKHGEIKFEDDDESEEEMIKAFGELKI